MSILWVGTLFLRSFRGCALEIIFRILDSVDKSGGWPVLVLLIVIAAIVYLARYMISKQMVSTEQRMTDRKQEFEQQLQRERESTADYRSTTDRMIDAFDKNSAAMSEFTGVLRPMSETLNRIDKHFDEQRPTRSQHTRE